MPDGAPFNRKSRSSELGAGRGDDVGREVRAAGAVEGKKAGADGGSPRRQSAVLRAGLVICIPINLKTAVDLGGRPQALESIEVATASHFTNLVTTAVSVTACRHKTWAESESSTAVFRMNKVGVESGLATFAKEKWAEYEAICRAHLGGL